jgi:hypothetical protein
MKTSHLGSLRATVVVLSSVSALSFAQTLPGRGNIDGTAAIYQGDRLDANVKIDKVLEIQGQPPAGWVPKFEFQVGVKENLPPAPQGCRWQSPVYAPPSGTTTVHSGENGVVQVKNVLVCEDKFCAEAKNIDVDLGKAINWLRTPSGPPMALVSPPPVGWAKPGTPPTGQFASSGEWAGLNSNGSGPVGTYTAQIPFCLCGDPSTARTTIGDLRGDNQVKVAFEIGTTHAQTSDTYNFGPFRHDVNGGGSITGGSGPSNHALIATVTNNELVTGFSMKGTLSIRKGYLGSCKPIK